MLFRKSSTAILMAVLLTVGSTAVAAQSQTDQQVTAMLEARKRSPSEVKWILSNLSDREKDEMLRQQQIIDNIVQVTPDPSALTEDERQRLWNATKVIDSLIAQNPTVADERLSCSQERTIGSQLAKRKCRTRAERDLEREDARRRLDNMQQGKR